MNTRRVRSGVLALAVGFGLGTAVIAAGQPGEPRYGARLGSLNFFRYCASAYAESSVAVLLHDDAYGWRCMVIEPLFATLDINVHAACSELYGVPAIAVTDDPRSPHRWACYRA